MDGHLRRLTGFAALLTLLIGGAGSATALEPSPARVIITGNEVWDPADGTVRVTETVRIAEGAQLTIEAGTQVESTANLVFQVAGTLTVTGSITQPASLSAPTGATLADFTQTGVADVSGLVAWGVTNPMQGAPRRVDLRDSRFIADRPNPFGPDATLPLDTRITHNEFFNSKPLWLAGFGDPSTGIEYLVRDNYFAGNESAGYQGGLFVTSTAGTIISNSFGDGTSQVAYVRGAAGQFPMSDTYWGTSNPGSRISDYDDDLNNPTRVTFEPPLTSRPISAAFVPAPPTDPAAEAHPESAIVSWSPPRTDGGSDLTDYVVTAQPGGSIETTSADSSSIEFTGLTPGESYRFTIVARNAVGDSLASTSTREVVPTSPTSVPGRPTDVSAVEGNMSARVSWTAPTTNGGSPITRYTITSSPGGVTKTVPGDQTTATITGLTNGTGYTFTVIATNATGTSPASAASNAVTPAAESEPNPAPATPSGFDAEVKGSKVVLTWDPPSIGDPAVIDYHVTSNKGLDKSFDARKTKLVLRNLDRGRHTFTLIASNDTGDSEPTQTKVRIR